MCWRVCAACSVFFVLRSVFCVLCAVCCVLCVLCVVVCVLGVVCCVLCVVCCVLLLIWWRAHCVCIVTRFCLFSVVVSPALVFFSRPSFVRCCKKGRDYCFC